MDNLFFELTTSLVNLVKPVISALSPLITGLTLAYLFSPMVSFFEEKIKSRSLAILVTYIIVFSLLGTMVYSFIVLITGALPRDPAATLETVKEYFENASAAFPAISDEASHKMQEWFTSRFSLPSVVDTVSSVSGWLVSIFLGAIAAIYLLKDKEYFISLWEKFLFLILRQRAHGIVNEVMSEINIVITTFIKGALVDSIIVAFLSSLVLTILRVNFAVIIGIIAGLLNIIPYFGPFISMVPAFLAAFFSGGLVHGLAAIGGLFMVQQLDSNYIYPKIVGNTTGLHPLFILLSISISGYFFGITGMLLTVPAAGILQVFIRRWAYNK
ncbi:MAG: AI-2E family transporter [Firmicutes bacterium]|nr:AI-2E family transporter [Bacillota bacterium]